MVSLLGAFAISPSALSERRRSACGQPGTLECFAAAIEKPVFPDPRACEPVSSCHPCWTCSGDLPVRLVVARPVRAKVLAEIRLRLEAVRSAGVTE